ncbi:MAG: hypothetical protein PF508_05310 [Spirochaeta sp.]|jgi:hypothetical protein|nr:hypothetical protein [Spirochaeta sp.]
MAYTLLTDDEILADLAAKLDHLRRSKKLKDEELVAKGGTSRFVLKKFRTGTGGITLKSFVRLLRGLGELDRLEALLQLPDRYSPSGRHDTIPAQRVRDKKTEDTDFRWGDDR